MAGNLLPDRWLAFDQHELRILLDRHFGGPGQYDVGGANKLIPNRLCLPLAGNECRIVLEFSPRKDNKERLCEIKAGPAFDSTAWKRIVEEVENSVEKGPIKIGRNYSFSKFRVAGSWQGRRSGLQ